MKSSTATSLYYLVLLIYLLSPFPSKAAAAHRYGYNSHSYQKKIIHAPFKLLLQWHPEHSRYFATGISSMLLLNTRGGENRQGSPPIDDDDDYFDERSTDDEEAGEDEDGVSYDDEDMDDVDEDEGAAMHQRRREQNINQRSKNNKHIEADVNPDPFTRRAPYPPRKKKQKNALSKIATSSLSLTKKAAATTVKTSGKAAFYLMRPKSIQEHELWGVWRLDQQVGMKQCTANVELTNRGDVVVRSGTDILWKSRYRFVQPTWPKSCWIEFEAPAFQPPNSKNNKPWMLRYKGTIERKVADKSVLKIVGTLYEIERPKGMFGKELPTRYNKIGSFVGRRRVVLQEEEEEEDEYSDVENEAYQEEYDPEGEEEGYSEDGESYGGSRQDQEDYSDGR